MTRGLRTVRPQTTCVSESARASSAQGHLPSIRNLATEYGVAAQTMQNALRELRNDKIVVAQQGRAFFVRNPDRPETGVGEADAERLAAAEAGLRDLPSPRWYWPELVAAAADALARANTPGRAVQAMADLRYAVSNDHAGSLCPAAVPAAGVLVEVILERPGEPRAYALGTLLAWLGIFRPRTWL